MTTFATRGSRNTGRVLIHSGIISGPVLAPFWIPLGTRSGPDLDQFGTRYGPDWDQLWTRSGSVWDQIGTSLGPVRDQFGTSPGPDWVQFVTSHFIFRIWHFCVSISHLQLRFALAVGIVHNHILALQSAFTLFVSFCNLQFGLRIPCLHVAGWGAFLHFPFAALHCNSHAQSFAFFCILHFAFRIPCL